MHLQGVDVEDDHAGGPSPGQGDLREHARQGHCGGHIALSLHLHAVPCCSVLKGLIQICMQQGACNIISGSLLLQEDTSSAQALAVSMQGRDPQGAEQEACMWTLMQHSQQVAGVQAYQVVRTRSAVPVGK